MKINDVVFYNNRKWKIVAIVGEYARIRLVGKRAEVIINIEKIEK